ncbi:hypothetical protein [Roseburia sp. 499]|uniref:hypothetical protein n=1 Tax=Roseburia sp. 499 TaxID=1261634 RepID=UPI00095346F0|nr:hypothetical protein [Roseburia sp. 499]WVK69562.1 hypothetical protein BIV20_14565 [Roseburia sp. 499]
MKQRIHYFRMDMWRCMKSGKMLVGALGVWFSLLLASGNQVGRNVFDLYTGALYGVPFLLTMSFCAFSYADCFCDDFETKYIRTELIRGNLKRYTLSKIIVTFIASVITMILGTCIYVFILHMWMPFGSGDRETGVYGQLLETGGFRYFLGNENYIIYFILVALQLGLLAGILSIFASYISLYISNKLFVLSVPMIGYYLLYYYISALVGDTKFFKVKVVFDATYGLKVCENDLFAFLYALFAAVIIGGILTLGIYCKIRRKLERE